MNLKQNLPIISAFSIPILIILFILAAVYLPQKTINPQFDFLYADSDYSSDYYQIKNNTLVPNPRTSSYPGEYIPLPPSLYIYEAAKDQSRKVTLEEASTLFIEDQPVSRDGYQISNNINNDNFGFFPFFYSDNPERLIYITDGKNSRKKINLPLNNSYYNFKFLGWVIN